MARVIAVSEAKKLIEQFIESSWRSSPIFFAGYPIMPISCSECTLMSCAIPNSF